MEKRRCYFIGDTHLKKAVEYALAETSSGWLSDPHTPLRRTRTGLAAECPTCGP